MLDESRGDGAQSRLKLRMSDGSWQNGCNMNRVPWLILLLLVALHHDFWFWNDASLIGGWMPIGLAWHMALSIVAAAFWLFAVRTAWPVEDEPQVAESAQAAPLADVASNQNDEGSSK